MEPTASVVGLLQKNGIIQPFGTASAPKEKGVSFLKRPFLWRLNPHFRLAKLVYKRDRITTIRTKAG
jgi:hypothetical protein